MEIELKEGLEFVNKNDPKDKFKLIKWRYYYQEEEIRCARTEDYIYLLGNVYLPDRYLVVDDEHIQSIRNDDIEIMGE